MTNIEDLDQYISVNESGGKCCGICYAFKSNMLRDLRDHIESKHFPNVFSYQCPDCDVVVNTNKAYRIHKSRKHRN